MTALLDRQPVEVTKAVLAPYIGYYLIEIEVPKIVNYGPAELYHLGRRPDQQPRPCLYRALNSRTFARRLSYSKAEKSMVTFLLWCLLLVVCWPLAIAALFIYPIVWLLLLPFRIVGIAVEGALQLVWSIVMLPVFVVRRLGRV